MPHSQSSRFTPGYRYTQPNSPLSLSVKIPCINSQSICVHKHLNYKQSAIGFFSQKGVCPLICHIGLVKFWFLFLYFFWDFLFQIVWSTYVNKNICMLIYIEFYRDRIGSKKSCILSLEKDFPNQRPLLKKSKTHFVFRYKVLNYM